MNARATRLQTADEYQRLLERRTSETTQPSPLSKFHGYAYDAVWTIAHTVNSIVAGRGGRYDDGDFRVDRRLHSALDRTDFLGVTVSALTKARVTPHRKVFC